MTSLVALTCGYLSCLTPCHRAFVSNSCHFSNGPDVLSGCVSLRAVYLDCLVRVEALFRPVPRVFASGEPIPSITASPMLEVSKRLITNVFRESEDVDKPARWAGKQLLLDTARTPSTRADLTVVG